MKSTSKHIRNKAKMVHSRTKMVQNDFNKSNKYKHFWNWKDGPNGRELYIYGTIAEDSWFDDDVTPEQFKAELMKGEGPITLWLNSYGGDCVAASRIYTMLLDYPYPTTVKIDGIAASAASVIAMAGSTVLMAPTACMVIHDPSTIAVGNSSDMEKVIRSLDTVKESIITAYEIKTGLPKEQLSDLMSKETWLSAPKAIELGFADGMLEKETLPVNNMAQMVPPVLFSQKVTDAALVNKLTGPCKGLTKPDLSSAGTLEMDSADHTIAIHGNNDIPAKPFYDRLAKLQLNTDR